MALLEVRGLRKRFGPTLALRGVDLEVERGEVLGLVGANGSGKSTLIRIVAGLVAPDAGEVLWEGRPFRPRDPRGALAQGIAVAYQEGSLLPLLSVADNLRLPFLALGRPLPARSELQSFLSSLGELPLEAPAGSLSQSQRQLLEVAKAMLLGPRLLILDEPTAALDREGVGRLFALLRRFVAAGGTVLFVTHRLGEVLELAHRVAVLRAGEVVGTLAARGLRPEELVRLMAGAEEKEEGQGAHEGAIPEGQPLLQVRGLVAPGLRGVDLQVAPGEVVGLGGLQGQGQRELLLALYGALPWEGEVWLAGRSVHPAHPGEALRLGIAYVGGDRAALAFLTRSVGENLLAASWAHFRRGPLLDLARAYASAAAVAKGLDLVYAGLEAPMASLSGGNQQKVLLGRALLAGPRLLLLDDPAVGVDPPTRTAFYRRVRALAREGLGVLLYASDEEELLQNAHRVLVLAGGRLVAELRGPELTREGLIAAGLRAGGGHG